MNEINNIERDDLLLSAQRAFYGSIDRKLSALCLGYYPNVNSGVLTIFSKEVLNLQQQEVIDTAATEILADFPFMVSLRLDFRVAVPEPLPCSGVWIYVREGCQVRS